MFPIATGSLTIINGKPNENQGSLDSMERGTVDPEWNNGMVERLNTGMAINDPVPFLLV